MTKSKISLTAAQLRALALIFMFIDHAGRTLFPEQSWMLCLGRLAFPIFAFQTAEGYRHTRDWGRYCLRLAVFALISEIPFNLLAYGAAIYPLRQNVMFTLLLGLVACRVFDRNRGWGLIPVFLAAALLRPDYGIPGVALVLLFHIFRKDKPAQLLFLILINGFGYGLGSIQSLAALAWIPISLYRGEKGRGGKALQYGSYIFYPLHMLILGLP